MKGLLALLTGVSVLVVLHVASAQDAQEMRALYPDVFIGSEPYQEFSLMEGFKFGSRFRGIEMFKTESVDACLTYCLTLPECAGFNAYVYVEGRADCTILDARNLRAGKPYEDLRYNYYKLETIGCADPSAHSYNETVTVNDEDMCITIAAGCTDPIALNFDENALVDNGTCYYALATGCTNSFATNFDSNAVVDDGSCVLAPKPGCTNSNAINYDPAATHETADNVCEFYSYGCLDPDAMNYNTHAMVHKDSKCVYGDEMSFDLFEYFHQVQISAPLLETGKDRLPKVVNQHECRVLCAERTDCKAFTHLWQTNSPWCEFYIAEQVKAAFKSQRSDMDYYEKVRFGCGDPRALTFDSTVDVNIGIHPEDDLFDALRNLPAWLQQALVASANGGGRRRSLLTATLECNDPTAVNYDATSSSDADCSYLRFDLDFRNPSWSTVDSLIYGPGGGNIAEVYGDMTVGTDGGVDYWDVAGTSYAKFLDPSVDLALSSTDEITFILWIRYTGNPMNYDFSGFFDFATSTSIQLGTFSNLAYINSGTGSHWTSTSQEIPSNTWMQYALVIGGSSPRASRAYVNGSQIYEEMSTAWVPANLDAPEFQLLCSSLSGTPNYCTTGHLARAQIYNKALTPAQITSDFAEFEALLSGPASGCTDPAAANYDNSSTIDDGSCNYLQFDLDIGSAQTTVTATEINSVADPENVADVMREVTPVDNGVFSYLDLGSNGYMVVNDTEALKIEETNELTWILWVKFHTTNGKHIFGFRDHSYGPGIRLGVENNGILLLAGGPDTYKNSSAAVASEEWIQYVLMVGPIGSGGAREWAAYINGSMVDSGSGTELGDFEMGTPFGIGAVIVPPSAKHYAKADLIRMQLFNKAIGETQITEDFDSFLNRMSGLDVASGSSDSSSSSSLDLFVSPPVIPSLSPSSSSTPAPFPSSSAPPAPSPSSSSTPSVSPSASPSSSSTPAPSPSSSSTPSPSASATPPPEPFAELVMTSASAMMNSVAQGHVFSQNGKFPVLNSPYMQDAVMTGTAIDPTKTYWLGAKKRGSTYFWWDGSRVDYTNWSAAPGTNDCVTMDGATGEWSTASCYASAYALYFDSYDINRNVYYYVHNTASSNSAADVCSGSGTRAATFESYEDLRQFLTQIKPQDSGFKHKTFALDLQYSIGAWRNAAGDVAKYTNLDGVQTGDCLALSGSDLKMRVVDCTMTTSALCEVDVPTSVSETAFVTNIHTSYIEAVKFCQAIGLGLPDWTGVANPSLDILTPYWVAPNRMRGSAWKVGSELSDFSTKSNKNRNKKCATFADDTADAADCEEPNLVVCSPETSDLGVGCPMGTGLEKGECGKCMKMRQAERSSCSSDKELAPITASDRFASVKKSVHYFAPSEANVSPSAGGSRRVLLALGDAYDDAYCDALWPGSIKAAISSLEELEFVKTFVSGPTFLGGVYVDASTGFQWDSGEESTLVAADYAGAVLVDGAYAMVNSEGLYAQYTAADVASWDTPMYPGLCEISNVVITPDACPEGAGKITVDGVETCIPCIDPSTSDGTNCVGECEDSEFFKAHIFVDQSSKRHCYGYFTGQTGLTFGAAEAACQSDWHGSHLITISDALEQQFIEENIEIPATGVFIGLQNKDMEHPWTRAVWADRTPHNGYAKWAWGEPGYKPGYQDCVFLQPDHKWNDVQCMERGSFICEYDTHKTFDPLQPLGTSLPEEWGGFTSADEILEWLQISSQGIGNLTTTMFELPGGSYMDLSLLPRHVNPYKTCYFPKYGCTRQGALNFDSSANEDDGSCYYYEIPGCIDTRALNYNPAANAEDGSCTFPVINGCTDHVANNYNPGATVEDGSCEYPVYGCTNTIALNYNSLATFETYECIFPGAGSYLQYIEYTDTQMSSPINGILRMKNMDNGDEECKYVCTELHNGAVAHVADDAGTCVGFNYNPHADPPFCQFFNEETLALARTVPNGDFTFFSREVTGCMDSTALNFDPRAIIRNDTACIPWVKGCMRESAANYNPDANFDDGTCSAVLIYGCMDAEALNFNTEATANDGSCTYPPTPGCTESLALNFNPRANEDNGTCIMPEYGCMDSSALNFNSLANVDDDSCIVVGSTSFYEYSEQPNQMIFSQRRNYAQLKHVESLDICKAWCESSKPCITFNWRADQAGWSFCQFFNAYAMEIATVEEVEGSIVYGMVKKGCLDVEAVNYDSTVQVHEPSACI